MTVYGIVVNSVLALQMNAGMRNHVDQQSFVSEVTLNSKTISSSSRSVTCDDDDTRRSFLNKGVVGLGWMISSTFMVPKKAMAASSSGSSAGKETLVSDLQVSRTKMEKIPSLLESGEWDAVRTILKTPPLNKLWNLGEVGIIMYCICCSFSNWKKCCCCCCCCCCIICDNVNMVFFFFVISHGFILTFFFFFVVLFFSFFFVMNAESKYACPTCKRNWRF